MATDSSSRRRGIPGVDEFVSAAFERPADAAIRQRRRRVRVAFRILMIAHQDTSHFRRRQAAEPQPLASRQHRRQQHVRAAQSPG